MKTTGALWNAYMASWPEGQWFDDSDEAIDGVPLDGADAPDGAEVEFTCGVVYRNEEDQEGKPLTRHFSAWKRALHQTIAVCEVPNGVLAEFRSFCALHCIKVKV